MWYIDFAVQSSNEDSVKNYQVHYALELFRQSFGIRIQTLYFSNYLN